MAEENTEVDVEAIELTAREVALAQGEDPDDAAEQVEDGGEIVTDDVDGGMEARSDAEEGATESASEDAGTETWIDEGVKSLAKTYGLGDEDLADFESEVEFLRFARVLEKRGGFAAAKPSDTVSAPEGDTPDDKADEVPVIDPQAYIDAGYDKETVALAKVAAAMQKQLSQFAPVFEQQQQAEHQRAVAQFDEVVDGMERYGKAADRKPEDIKRRETLWNTAGVVAQDLAAKGIGVPPMPVLLKRAELVAFGDEILAEKKAKFAGTVKSQSAKRRSVGRTAANTGKKPAADGADDPVAAIANSPELKKFWQENSTD